MTDEIALWKQRILERKANRLTIADWCKEHDVRIHLSRSQEAHLAEGLITYLRRPY